MNSFNYHSADDDAADISQRGIEVTPCDALCQRQFHMPANVTRTATATNPTTPVASASSAHTLSLDKIEAPRAGANAATIALAVPASRASLIQESVQECSVSGFGERDEYEGTGWAGCVCVALIVAFRST